MCALLSGKERGHERDVDAAVVSEARGTLPTDTSHQHAYKIQIIMKILTPLGPHRQQPPEHHLSAASITPLEFHSVGNLPYRPPWDRPPPFLPFLLVPLPSHRLSRNLTPQQTHTYNDNKHIWIIHRWSIKEEIRDIHDTESHRNHMIPPVH